MDRKNRGKNMTAKRKLTTRWTLGTWVGVVERTGEHIIVTRSVGRAVRAWSIKRVPEVARWNSKAVLEMQATPRYPNPRDKSQQEVTIQMEAQG